MNGYSREELIGQSIDILNPAVADEAERAAYLERLRREGVLHYEDQHRRKDGTLLPIEVSTRLIALPDGELVLGIDRDITERKQMEDALAQARDQAMTASRLKSEFLATMSHEIRTPMNSIIGMSEMLLGTPQNDQQREFATIIDQSGQALLSLINDILDFSKIEAGKFSLENIDFDVPMTIEGTAEILAVKTREKHLALMTYISPEIPRWLRGDPGRLRQVLINLIGNAVKFTEQGEIVVRVELESKSETGVTVHFGITDTGIGISQEARQRLFQPFTQADGSTTRKYGGTGLGLAISKRLVEMMGGTIGVESEAGHGSTFWFTARFENASLVVPARVDVRGLRVLVVDDVKSHRTIVQNYLFSWGMHAQGVANGNEALQTLRDAVTRKEALRPGHY